MSVVATGQFHKSKHAAVQWSGHPALSSTQGIKRGKKESPTVPPACIPTSAGRQSALRPPPPAVAVLVYNVRKMEPSSDPVNTPMGRVGTFHVILQSKQQLMTASMVHITNLTPGSENPTHGRHGPRTCQGRGCRVAIAVGRAGRGGRHDADGMYLAPRGGRECGGQRERGKG